MSNFVIFRNHEPLLRKVFGAISLVQDGATALFLAAQEGHVTVMRHLLSSGAKVNQAREVVS